MYIFIFIYLVYIFYKTRTSLYMLQQNLYNENDRYLRWIKRNAIRCYDYWDFLAILPAIVLFFASDSFIKEVVFVTITLIIVKGIYDEYKKNLENQNKIKFVITSRIKRLYFTEFLIICLLLLLLIMFNFSVIVLISLLLVSCFIYYFIFIVSIINKPVEKMVYLYYYQKAKAKLN